MDLVVIESEAFYKLAEEIEQRAIKRYEGNRYMTDEETMAFFGIKNKSYWSTFKSKHQIPSSKIGGQFLFKRSEIEQFVLKHRTT